MRGTLDITFSSLPHKHPLCDIQPAFPLFLQDGWTAILLAARYGHKKVVQELCETYGADFLHRKKVRAMKTDVAVRGWVNYACADFSYCADTAVA